MNTQCGKEKRHIQNYNDISCCLEYLIQLNNKTENNLLTTKYGVFLLRTLNHYSKKENFLSSSVSLDKTKSLLQIITKYSSFYYFRKKKEYTKLIIKCGIDIINQSKYKDDESIIDLKNALVNNVACIYFQIEQSSKSAKFLDKCVKMNRSYIDNAITYNNYGFIEISNKRIKSGVHYFHLMYKEIKGKLKDKNANENEKELFCFLLMNYLKTSKKYSINDYISHYEEFYNYVYNTLGSEHYITNEILLIDTNSERIKEEKNENENSKKTENIFTISNFKKDNDINFFFKEKTKSEIQTQKPKAHYDTSSPFFPNKSFSTSPQETPIFQKRRNTETTKKENQDMFLLSSKNPKPTTKLPFKRKLKLKDVFNMALQATSSSKPKSKFQQIFSFLGKSAPPLPKQMEQNSKNIVVLNEYDEIMRKVTEKQKKVEIVEMSNSTIKSKIQSVEKIQKESKRNSVMNRVASKEKDNIKVKSSFPTEDVKRRATQLFKQLLLGNKEEIKSYPDYIENIINFTVLDDLNNFLLSKIKKEVSIEEEVAKMIERTDQSALLNHTMNDLNSNCICKIFQMSNNIPYIISVNSVVGENSINFQIKNVLEKKIVYESNALYEDMIDYLLRISYYDSMPTYADLNQVLNIQMLVAKVLSNHLQIMGGNEITLGLSEFQIGISEHKFEFSYLETPCFFSLNISCNIIVIILNNKNNEKESIRFDITADEGSFNTLFRTITDYGVKKYVYNSNFNYNSFFSEIFSKTQEIHKISSNNENITFSDFVQAYPHNVYKLYFEKKLQKKELWMITFTGDFMEEFTWKVDFYSLDKIEISNASFYINKSLILDSQDFINIIGMAPEDVCGLLSEKDKVTCNYILLHSVKMRNIVMKILTERNYDSMIRLMKIKPSCFFRFAFAMTHVKRYFCCAFEFVVYSRENFFLRLMLTETVTCRTYSKLFLPYIMISTITNMNELKKNLEYKFNLSKKLFKNKKKLRQVLYDESENMLTKNPHLVIFENIDIILEKLNQIKG